MIDLISLCCNLIILYYVNIKLLLLYYIAIEHFLKNMSNPKDFSFYVFFNFNFGLIKGGKMKIMNQFLAGKLFSSKFHFLSFILKE